MDREGGRERVLRVLNARIFIDFDNTVTIGDTGNELVQSFGTFQPFHADLHAGKHSVAEYYRLIASTLRADATPAALHAWALQAQVDASFSKLVAWAASVHIPFTVVSDGFDVYIHPILEQLGLASLPVACNLLVYDGASWTPQFPGASESCTCFCASCKRNALLRTAADDDVLIYIGDGMSDACAAEHADVVFAKGALAAYCTAHGIPHHHFRTLHDVLSILRTLHASQAFRQRRQAQLARKRAFERE